MVIGPGDGLPETDIECLPAAVTRNGSSPDRWLTRAARPARNHGCLTISTSGTVPADVAAGFDLFIIAAAFALMS